MTRGKARMKATVLSTILVLAAVAPAALASAGPAAPSRSSVAQCPRLSGPAVHQAGQTLSHYVVGAHGGVTCAFARTWVAKILREPTPTSSLAKPNGPAGWQCIATAKAHVAFNGSCRSGARSLSWGAI
jgi:hypothetical protein